MTALYHSISQTSELERERGREAGGRKRGREAGEREGEERKGGRREAEEGRK